MLIDLSPLIKYRDFRLLYLGQFISMFGNMLTYVAFPYQVYQLTHSTLAVGAIGVVELVPLLITSLWGGVLADRMDRRTLLLGAVSLLILISVILWINSLPQFNSLWLLFILAAVGSGLEGLFRPALDAITQVLVPAEEMPKMMALVTFQHSVSMIAGPALAGVMLANVGLPSVYFLDTLTFVVLFISIYFIRTRYLPETSNTAVFQSLKEGMQYAMSRQELIGTYVVDFAAMIFGMPMALFPAIAERFHSVVALGWLYAGPSIGMLIASLFSGWVSRIKRHGVAISMAACVWGGAIIVFGFTHHLFWAIAFLAIAGMGDAISGLFRGAIWNQTIPKNLRGRLASIEMISYMSGPLLGNAEAGLVAHYFGVSFSIVSGGVLCIITVILFVFALPRFWRYKANPAD